MELLVDVSEVIGMFDELLTERQRGNTIRSAKIAAATVIRKRAAKSHRFQDQSGTLRKSLRTNKTGVKTTRKGNVYAVAGISETIVLPGGGELEGDPYYALFVERGHGGPSPAPPKLFMEEALIASEEAAVQAFQDRFSKRVNAIAARGKRKGRNNRARR